MEQTLIDAILDGILKDIEESGTISRGRLHDVIVSAHAVWTVKNKEPLDAGIGKPVDKLGPGTLLKLPVTERPEIRAANLLSNEADWNVHNLSRDQKYLLMTRGLKEGSKIFDGLTNDQMNSVIDRAYAIWDRLATVVEVDDFTQVATFRWKDSMLLRNVVQEPKQTLHIGRAILRREREIMEGKVYRDRPRMQTEGEPTPPKKEVNHDDQANKTVLQSWLTLTGAAQVAADGKIKVDFSKCTEWVADGKHWSYDGSTGVITRKG